MTPEQAQKRALASAKQAWKEHQSYSSNRDVEDFSYPYQIGYLSAYNDLSAKIEKLVKALEFYADTANWYDDVEVGGTDRKSIWKDFEVILQDKHVIYGGRRARQALEEFKK